MTKAINFSMSSWRILKYLAQKHSYYLIVQSEQLFIASPSRSHLFCFDCQSHLLTYSVTSRDSLIDLVTKFTFKTNVSPCIEICLFGKSHLDFILFNFSNLLGKGISLILKLVLNLMTYLYQNFNLHNKTKSCCNFSFLSAIKTEPS